MEGGYENERGETPLPLGQTWYVSEVEVSASLRISSAFSSSSSSSLSHVGSNLTFAVAFGLLSLLRLART